MLLNNRSSHSPSVWFEVNQTAWKRTAKTGPTSTENLKRFKSCTARNCTYGIEVGEKIFPPRVGWIQEMSPGRVFRQRQKEVVWSSKKSGSEPHVSQLHILIALKKQVVNIATVTSSRKFQQQRRAQHPTRSTHLQFLLQVHKTDSKFQCKHPK